MTAPVEKRFRRMLRWYPRSWREANERVVLSTMLESAEQDGRQAPTAAEAVFSAIHGTAARVDRRFALVTSLAAAACAAFAGVSFVWGFALNAVPILLSGAIPLFAAWALVAVLRQRGLLGDGRALTVLGVSLVALSLNALTIVSWSLGFDAADAGIPPTGLAAAWLPLAVAAVLTGALASGLLVDALLRRTEIPPVARAVIAGVIGLVAAPMIGLGLLSPAVAGLAALGAVILALLPSRPARHLSPPAQPLAPAVVREQPPSARVDSARRWSIARVLAWIAAGGGVIGVAYALTGSLWAAAATDGTVAMARGISLLLVSAIPLLAGVGLVATAGRSRIARVHRWAPLTLVALALGVVAFAYQYAPSWTRMSPWLQISSVLAGAAIAWWIIPRVRLPRAAAVTIGVGAGVLYAVFLGILIAPMLAFAVPIGALLLGLWRPRPAVVADAGVHRPAAVAQP